ncbi:hypothetical protein JQK19_13150 [Chromobacterium violaceum]|uniref:hypothetical protein n=1 Tax=Chromobacterium violaceum TaxID=536 RepID=UPI001BE9C24F|nr:hypothetical protein [Chromobacterium violaceum]MBT2868189.1 hypothetical protein [Chromobacterium violaceum]
MSISNTDTSNAYWQQLHSMHQQCRQDFSNLTQSVQQGDIAGAQQALAALHQLKGSAGSGSDPDFSAMLNHAVNAASASSSDPYAALNDAQTTSGSSSSVSSLLNALGQDLQAGNLSQAQQAFQQLQQGLQQADASQAAGGRHHPHHHHGGQQQSGQTDSLASLLNAVNGNGAASGSSALSSLNQQQTQAALSLFQANASNNDISSLLMSLSV